MKMAEKSRSCNQSHLFDYLQGPPRPGFSPGPGHPGSGPGMGGPPRMGMPGPHGGMPPHPYGGEC